MIDWVNNLRLSHKTSLIVFITSTISLIMATVFITYYSDATARIRIAEQLKASALQVGASSRAALLYGDKTAATRYLRSFSLNPNIVAAAFITDSDKIFAEYQRDPTTKSLPIIDVNMTSGSSDNKLYHIETIYEGNQKLGYIYVLRDTNDIAKERTNTLIFMSLVTLVCTLTALAFGSQVQKLITDPFKNLLNITALIQKNQDYTARATRTTNDELGELADSFNQMLMEVQRRDQALQISKERFRAIIENTSEIICVLNRQYQLSYLNPTLAAIIGEQKTNFEFTSLPNIRDKEKLNSALDAAVDQAPKAIICSAVQLRNIDNEVVYLDLSITCLFDTLGVDGLVIHGRDITEKFAYANEREKLISELEEKNTELENFTYTVSHDLKSPLVTINGFAGLLKSDIENNRLDKLDEDIECIQNAAKTMQKQLQDLLDLSRIGRIMKAPQLVSLQHITTNTIRLLEGTIKANNININIDEPLADAYGDAARLMQVIQNLLENAIKFMGAQQHPEITISTQIINDFLHFRITDNGIGIDSRYLDKIFGLFDRLDPKTEGTGIGLSLVKRIATVHGGEVWAESEGLGNGTNFVFKIPVERK